MVIVSRGDELIKEQIVSQLAKLVDVREVQLMDTEKIVIRELLIVKVRMNKSQLAEITEAAKTFRASVIDLSPDSMLIEITGEPGKLAAFLEYFRQYGIIEMVRTGPTSIGRNGYCLVGAGDGGEQEA
jgi:acetolactate synthase-1/3 small subunit